MPQIPQLPAARFTWEKYIGKVGWSVADVLKNVADVARPSLNPFKPEVTVLGFCQAKNLVVRPRNEGYAVLVEIEGDEVWLHMLNV